MEEKWKYFGGKVDQLIKHKDLTRSEAKEMFRQALLNEQPDLQQRARRRKRSPEAGRQYTSSIL